MALVLDRPTADEDAVLRRLHCFEQLGCALSPQMRAVKDDIRRRDRRAEIRDPDHTVLVLPVQDRTGD